MTLKAVHFRFMEGRGVDIDITLGNTKMVSIVHYPDSDKWFFNRAVRHDGGCLLWERETLYNSGQVKNRIIRYFMNCVITDDQKRFHNELVEPIAEGIAKTVSRVERKEYAAWCEENGIPH